jgi:hypothetical protein
MRRICAFDNVAGMSEEMAGAHTRLSTGSGIGGRKLYTEI